EGSALVAADGEQAAHMFFADALSRVFATHPPILERIRELDPQFDPRELERAAAEPNQDPSMSEVTAAGTAGDPPAAPPAPGGAGGQVSPGPFGSAAARSQLAGGSLAGGGIAGFGQIPRGATRIGVQQAAAAVAQVGQPDTVHIERAQAVRLALPPGAREL